MRSWFGKIVLVSMLVVSLPLHATTVFPMPASDSGAYEYVSGLLCYMAKGLGHMGLSHAECLAGENVPMQTEVLPTDLQRSIGELAVQVRPRPPDLLDWWDQTQPLTLLQRNQLATVPQTLERFLASTHYVDWPKTIIPVSTVKRRTRVIYRSPDSVKPAISVAVTYDSQTGDLTTPVRETEIAVEREDSSGNADFYSYDHLGRLSSTSTFPSGARPVPSSCMGCHFRRNDRVFPREGL